MRFKSIDALRGMAATLVVFYHVWNRFYPGLSSQRHSVVLPGGAGSTALFFLLGFGYLGVDLFFVLSGFCIHLPQALKFHATGSDRLSLPKFGRRRFFRLYPAYAASLVWTSVALLLFPVLAALVTHRTINLVHLARLPDLLFSALFLQQVHPESLSFNGVYWTLLYEVQFYLLYPVLLWVCRRWGFRYTGVILLLLEAVCIVKPTGIPDFFLSRYFEWFLGMYLAEVTAERKPLILPLWSFPLMAAIALGSVFHPFTWPLRDLLASVASAILLALCIEREPHWQWLTPKWIVAVGVFSYSLYLVHIPVIDVVWNGLSLARRSAPGIPLILSVLAIPMSFVMGYFFFRWFEQPFLGETKRGPAIASSSSERTW